MERLFVDESNVVPGRTGQRGQSTVTLAAVTAVDAEGHGFDSLSLARWFRNLCARQIVSVVALDEMTDFDKRPEYGLGIIDRRGNAAGERSGTLAP